MSILASSAIAEGPQDADEICGAPLNQARAEILWTKALCKEPGRYIGWPTVGTAPNGDLLAVFSGDRDAHICPWGKVQMVRSAAGGLPKGRQTLNFGLQGGNGDVERYAGQLRQFARIVRGEEKEPDDLCRHDLAVQRALLTMCGLFSR